MILSGKSINEIIESGLLKVFPDAQIKEASIKVFLSSKIGKERNNYHEFKEYILQPKEFILALSQETFEFPDNYAGLYDDHIHMSCQGIFTHLGSMLIEPEFKGQILLEIYNASDKPFKLEPGMRAGNLMVVKVD